MKASEPRDLLRHASTILLVDWLGQDIPRALLRAGFRVFGYSPGGYSQAELREQKPSDPDARVFPPETPAENGYLTFQRCTAQPAGVDTVAIYRPAAEVRGIIVDQVEALGAKTLWALEPLSDDARELAARLGIAIVEGVDIGETARGLYRAARSITERRG